MVDNQILSDSFACEMTEEKKKSLNKILEYFQLLFVYGVECVVFVATDLPAIRDVDNRQYHEMLATRVRVCVCMCQDNWKEKKTNCDRNPKEMCCTVQNTCCCLLDGNICLSETCI